MAAPVGPALRRRAAFAAAAAAALAAALALRARFDPAVQYLPGGGAAWIVVPRPLALKAAPAAPRFARFRLRFASAAEGTAELRLRARHESQAVLNGRVVLPAGRAEGGWKAERRVPLRLQRGARELLVVARADSGPAAIAAELRGAEGAWEAWTGAAWTPAAPAGAPRRAEDFAERPSAAAGFLATLPWLLPFAALGAWLSRRGLRRPWLWAGAGWAALAAWSCAGLPASAGYDSLAHAELARRLAAGALPGPGESWQSFQAPLYHLLCAPLSALAADDEALARLMRLPNLLSGFLLAWLCARFAALARPREPAAAAAAALFALALAPNLYMSQAPGNEPLAALLAAAFLAGALRLSGRETGAADAFLLGAALGAALLAKTTAVLALPAGLFLLGRRRPAWWGSLALGVLLTGGWWYLRGWLLHGAPFTGGWDPSRGLAWTQDPGYRTAADFLRFGAALDRPVYSGVAGFWDALYSTLWLDGWQGGVVNPGVVLRPPRWQAACALWGLVPSALLAAGAWRALRREDRAAHAALLALGSGLAALLWLFLSVPAYSTVKASYLLGLTPAAALLVSDGLPRAGRARTAGWALLSAWAACSLIAHIPL